MMSCQSFSTASGSAVKALRRLMPALLTRIETCPTCSAIFSATAMQSSRRVTSSAKLSAWPPASADFLGSLAGRLRVDVEQRHLRALAGIAERDRAADPGSRAGDDGDVILEQGHGGVSSVGSLRRHQAVELTA